MKVNEFLSEVYMFMLGKNTKYNMGLLEKSNIKDFIREHMVENSKLHIKYKEHKSKEAREIYGRPYPGRARSIK